MQQQDFTPSMIAGCEAALDAGVFYQDVFVDWVIDRMGGFGCEATLASTLTIDRDAPQEPRQEFLSIQSLQQRIAGMPRGHYAIIKTTGSGGNTFFRFVVSDGSGDVSTGGKYDAYDIEPSAELVLRKMLEYEIYLCREFVEQRRQKARDIEALTFLNIHVGMKIKDYKAPGDVRPFSSATVIEVHPETGMLKLLLMRRGTSKRWEDTVGATWLKGLLTEVEAPADNALC